MSHRITQEVGDGFLNQHCCPSHSILIPACVHDEFVACFGGAVGSPRKGCLWEMELRHCLKFVKPPRVQMTFPVDSCQ